MLSSIIPGQHCPTISASNKVPDDSSLLWDRNKDKMEPHNLFVIKQQQQQQKQPQNDSSCDDGGVLVASFWSYNPERAHPKRGRLRPTKSLPSPATTNAWNAFMPAFSAAAPKVSQRAEAMIPSPPIPLRRSTSIQRGVPRNVSNASSTTTDNTHTTHQQMEEENELLREQVRILQATLQEREQERTGDSLALLEDSVATRESSWHKDKSTREQQQKHYLQRGQSTNNINDENNSEAQLQRVIELSMELAESQAQVDSLQGKLQHAEHRIENLTKQLATTTVSSSQEPFPITCTKDNSLFRSWFGSIKNEAAHATTPSTPKRIFQLPQKKNSTDTILTFDSTVAGDGDCGDSDSLASCSGEDDEKGAAAWSVERQDIEKVAMACGAMVVD